MTGGDGYLSRDREYLARMQRQRRARMVRIDYMPSSSAWAVVQAERAHLRPNSCAATNSATIDRIVLAWAEATGLKKREIEAPTTSASVAGINSPFRAGAYDFGQDLEVEAAAKAIANRAITGGRRVICGAKRHRDGQPCRARSEPTKRRCRFHGGRSTGPRTPEGKARSLANLKRKPVASDGGTNSPLLAAPAHHESAIGAGAAATVTPPHPA